MKPIIVVLASVAHLLPHPFGVSSVGALALYSGAHGDRKGYWLTPWVPLVLGLLITGLFTPVVMIFVFVGYALAAMAGRWLLKSQRSLPRFAGAITVGAVIFFLVSNFSVWLAGFYPPTLAGLIACYVAGLPYLAIAALADAAYCFVLFGLHRLIDHQSEARVTA